MCLRIVERNDPYGVEGSFFIDDEPIGVARKIGDLWTLGSSKKLTAELAAKEMIESRIAEAQRKFNHSVAQLKALGFTKEAATYVDLLGDDAKDPIPYQKIVDFYNEIMTGLPKVRDLTDKRKRAIRKACKANDKRRTLGFWRRYFEECADNPVLSGQEKFKDWSGPTFDYLIREDIVTREYEKALHRLENSRHAA